MTDRVYDCDAIMEIEKRHGDLAPAPELPDASCRGLDPDSWVPDEFDQPALAVLRSICANCPALAPCREWAIEQPTWTEGFWAGMTQNDRNLAKAARNRARWAVAA